MSRPRLTQNCRLQTRNLGVERPRTSSAVSASGGDRAPKDFTESSGNACGRAAADSWVSLADSLGTLASSRGGLTGGGRNHSLSRHRRDCGMECAVPRHWAPASAHPARQLLFRPFCGVWRTGLTRREGTAGRSSLPRARSAQAGGGGGIWHLRAPALTGERRGRRSPRRFLEVDGHGRTHPRLRAALTIRFPRSAGAMPSGPDLKRDRAAHAADRGRQGCRSADTIKNPLEACVKNQLPSKPVPGAVTRRAFRRGPRPPQLRMTPHSE